MIYQTDFLNAGTPTADSTYDIYVPARAFDNNEGTGWLSEDSAFPHWIKYDLGAGVFKKARKLRLLPQDIQLEDFTLEGSNDNSTWVQFVSDTASGVTEWQEWEFDNPTAYRYYRITVTSNQSEADEMAGILEIELMEASASRTKFNRGFN